MNRRKKLEEEITRLTYRVKELEERLCPCESHSWKYIMTDYNSFDVFGDAEANYTYQCMRCGKRIRTQKRDLDEDND